MYKLTVLTVFPSHFQLLLFITIVWSCFREQILIRWKSDGLMSLSNATKSSPKGTHTIGFFSSFCLLTRAWRLGYSSSCAARLAPTLCTHSYAGNICSLLTLFCLSVNFCSTEITTWLMHGLVCTLPNCLTSTGSLWSVRLCSLPTFALT